MKIAILGARGFVGSSLSSYFTKDHIVCPITRDTLDLLDPIKVRQFLENQKFDVVINAAAVMTDSLALHDTRNNLGIYMNFFNNSSLFGKFINLASGAEYDRSTDINSVTEDFIFRRLPQDSYGFGQNIKSRLSFSKEHFYNLRIFNCFGKEESSSRIFQKFIKAQINPRFEIQNDRYFDYFSIQDLCKVVDSFINNNYSIKDINCVYLDKYKISEVLEKFCLIKELKSNYVVTSTSENNYCGSGAALHSLGIDLEGLEKGFERY
jgi:nucleoside-diphosphate-sugar epimerase